MPRDHHESVDPTLAESSRRVYFTPIIALAFVLRLLMALSFAKENASLWFYNQASELGCLAHSLNTGLGYASPFCGVTGPSAFLAPGYPLFVAFIFRLFGEFSGESAVVLVGSQIFFGLGIVINLMLIARRTLGTQAANLAGAVCAISPTLVWLPVLFWETSLSILLLTGALTLAIHCIDKSTRRNWAGMGLLCSFAMLVNPALTITLAAIFAWMTWQNGRLKLSVSNPLIAAVVWMLVFAGWPVRNQIVLHSFIPLRSNLGYELWQGNHQGSDGSFSPELHLNVNRVERSRYVELGEVAYMREKSMLAIAAIKANPARFVQLSLRRFGQFWIGMTSHRNSAFIIGSLSLTSTLAACGLVLLARQERTYAILLSLPFVILPLPYYVTHADFRFRLLLDPLAIMLATYTIQSWYRHLSTRRVRSSLAVTITA